MLEPAYKASLPRSALKDLRADPQQFQSIAARVDPRHLHAIDDASRLAWLDAIHFDELNRAVLEELGEAGYVEFWRRQTTALVRTPLFGPILKGSLSLFGVGPTPLLKLLDRARMNTTRGIGDVKVVFDERGGHAELVLTNLPAPVRLRTVSLSMKGALLAVLEIGRVREGHVDMNEARLGEGEATFALSWVEA